MLFVYFRNPTYYILNPAMPWNFRNLTWYPMNISNLTYFELDYNSTNEKEYHQSQLAFWQDYIFDILDLEPCKLSCYLFCNAKYIVSPQFYLLEVVGL